MITRQNTPAQAGTPAGTPPALVAAGQAYLAAGRSALPVAPGTKWPGHFSPDLGGYKDLPWQKYRKHRMDAKDLTRLMHYGPCGVSIVMGKVSGREVDGVWYSLETIDIDDPDTFDAFLEAANWRGLGELLTRLVRERTPRMGGHLGYLCAEVDGNLQLARRPGTPDDPIPPGKDAPPAFVTLIETRGEGGQCVVAPTPPGIHPAVPDKGYVLTHGSWEDPPIITPDERAALFELARSFNTYVDPKQIFKPSNQPRAAVNGDRPGDQLNATATLDWWTDLLNQHGWTCVGQRGAVLDWQRPGKEGKGASATLGACGIYFYVFSSNAAPFEAGRAYSPFSAYGLLTHGGDFTQAAKALAPTLHVDNKAVPTMTGQHGTTPAHAAITLLLNKGGSTRGALGNVLAVLTEDPRWDGVLGYNALSDDVMFLRPPPCYPDDVQPWHPRPLEDHDDAEIANWMQWRYEIFCGTSTVHEAVQAAAHRHAYHPIRDYLASLTWQGERRLDTWLSTYCGAEDNAYTRAVGAITLIGAVARVMRPGCKMDTCTTLMGDQGIGKSTTWRVLCGDEWFSDTTAENVHQKDAMQNLRGTWIFEFGDLASYHRSEIEDVKRYLSATQDRYRPSYGRRPRTFLRQNIFVGSTNKRDFLKDETGNRRFYPIEIPKGHTCTIAALAQDRDQLWAEAMHRYQQGEAWYLSGDVVTQAAEVQADHMEHDAWTEKVLAYVHRFVGNTKITTTEVMEWAFQWENPALWTPVASKRIGAILRGDGWRPVKRYAHDASPTKAKTDPDPKDPQRGRVAAFWKDTPPGSGTDGTDTDTPASASVPASTPHEIKPGTDGTDGTDTFIHVRKEETANTGMPSDTPTSARSSLYIGKTSVQAVPSVPDRMNTSEEPIWPICAICAKAHNPADICAIPRPRRPW